MCLRGPGRRSETSAGRRRDYRCSGRARSGSRRQIQARSDGPQHGLSKDRNRWRGPAETRQKENCGGFGRTASPRPRTTRSTTISTSTTTWKPIQYAIGAPSSIISMLAYARGSGLESMRENSALRIGHGKTGCGKKSQTASEVATRAKAPNVIAQRLSGFENPLPQTKVRGYTRACVFPQPVKPSFVCCAYGTASALSPSFKGSSPRTKRKMCSRG